MARAFLASSCWMTKRSRCALTSLGLRWKSNSISLRFGSSVGGVVSTVSVWGEAKTTRSPNSCFMNSESFFWISSGDGNGWSELMAEHCSSLRRIFNGRCERSYELFESAVFANDHQVVAREQPRGGFGHFRDTASGDGVAPLDGEGMDAVAGTRRQLGQRTAIQV